MMFWSSLPSATLKVNVPWTLRSVGFFDSFGSEIVMTASAEVLSGEDARVMVTSTGTMPGMDFFVTMAFGGDIWESAFAFFAGARFALLCPPLVE